MHQKLSKWGLTKLQLVEKMGVFLRQSNNATNLNI